MPASGITFLPRRFWGVAWVIASLLVLAQAGSAQLPGPLAGGVFCRGSARLRRAVSVAFAAVAVARPGVGAAVWRPAAPAAICAALVLLTSARAARVAGGFAGVSPVRFSPERLCVEPGYHTRRARVAGRGYQRLGGHVGRRPLPILAANAGAAAAVPSPGRPHAARRTCLRVLACGAAAVRRGRAPGLRRQPFHGRADVVDGGRCAAVLSADDVSPPRAVAGLHAGIPPAGQAPGGGRVVCLPAGAAAS